MSSSAASSGKRSNGGRTGSGNPTVGATRTKDEAKIGSWPMITSTLSMTRNVTPFNIHFWKYVVLCVDVYDVMRLSLRRHEFMTLPLKKFIYLMVMALARRVYDLVEGFGDESTDQSMDAPILPKNLQIPRPVYCFLACIGDLRIADLNLNLRPQFDCSTVKALVFSARDILAIDGDNEDAVRVAVLGYRLKIATSVDANTLAIEKMRFFLTRFFELECVSETDVQHRDFIRSAYALRGVNITQARAGAIRDLFQGWIVAPPFNESGIFALPDGFDLLDLGANHEIKERMGELHRCALIYEGIAIDGRNFQTAKVIRISPAEIDVLDRMRQCYSCSAGTPTSLNGSPCQLMTEEQLSSGGFVISSTLPASGTHLGMGVVCKFNPVGDLPLESSGYTTVLQADQPQTIVNQWIASNKIANRPK